MFNKEGSKWNIRESETIRSKVRSIKVSAYELLCVPFSTLVHQNWTPKPFYLKSLVPSTVNDPKSKLLALFADSAESKSAQVEENSSYFAL